MLKKLFAVFIVSALVAASYWGYEFWKIYSEIMTGVITEYKCEGNGYSFVNAVFFQPELSIEVYEISNASGVAKLRKTTFLMDNVNYNVFLSWEDRHQGSKAVKYTYRLSESDDSDSDLLEVTELANGTHSKSIFACRILSEEESQISLDMIKAYSEK
jgi:hypothetical protein